MTKLLWGAVGERYFEAGVDRGVLYVSGVGVAWNGLKSVKENPQGGEPRPFYIDGLKYLNIAESEEFQATIEAFSAPFEFNVCDGSKQLYAGLIATQQPRKSFGLSYRTKVGNDISGLDLGYKIHLVYDALAGPSGRDRTSLGGSTDPISLSWDVTTVPPITSGIRPTAHMVIDSRTTPPLLLEYLENILYGTSLSNPRLPLPTELIAIFASEGPASYARINELPNPRFKDGFGWGRPVGLWSAGSDLRENQLFLSTSLNEYDALVFEAPDGHVALPEEVWTGSVDITVPEFYPTITLALALFTYKSDAGYHIYYGPTVTIAAGETKRLTCITSPLEALTNNVVFTVVVKATTAVNSYVEFNDALLEKSAELGEPFNGNTPDSDGYFYSWAGTPDQSPSGMKTWLI